MPTDILFKRLNGGARIVFNRPKVRNALTAAMLAEVATILDDVARDTAIRFLVFEGAGSHFMSGGDLASYAAALDVPARDRQLEFERRVRGNAETFLRLHALEKPVISVVRGAVAGAGLSFVLASDFVIASDDAFLIFAQPRVGLPLDLGLTYLLPRVVGLKAAKKLALTAGRLDASEAHRIGIIDEVRPLDEIESALASLVRGISSTAPRAAGRSKTLLIQSEYRSLVEQMEHEVRAIGSCVAEPDFAEGVRAFVEKRDPAFGGFGG